MPRSRPASSTQPSCIPQPCSETDFNRQLAPSCQPQSAVDRDREQATSLERRKSILNAGESLVHDLGETLPRGIGGASSMVPGRWSVDNAYLQPSRISARSRLDKVGKDKCSGDDPAAVPSQERRRCSASDVRGREPTGHRRRVWNKVGQVCRGRVYKTLSTWRDRIVGAGPRSESESKQESKLRPGSERDPDAGGQVYRVPAPRVGATAAPGRLAKTMATTTTDMKAEPEMSRRRGDKFVRSRPTSASAWLIGAMSTSTQRQTRESRRLVKRRPKSTAMAGEHDSLAGRSCARGRVSLG